LDRLRQMRRVDRVVGCQVGDGAGHLEGAGGEVQSFERRAVKLGAEAAELLGAHGRIVGCGRAEAETVELNGASVAMRRARLERCPPLALADMSRYLALLSVPSGGLRSRNAT
jgi:hypothetical protein